LFGAVRQADGAAGRSGWLDWTALFCGRAELTALERDNLVAEWVELTGEKTVQDAQFSQAGPGRGKKEGLSEASRQLGIERTDVHRALKVASLSPGHRPRDYERD